MTTKLLVLCLNDDVSFQFGDECNYKGRNLVTTYLLIEYFLASGYDKRNIIIFHNYKYDLLNISVSFKNK